MGTENPDCVQHEDSVSQEIFNTRQEIDTSAVVSTKAKPGQKSGKSEPEREKFPTSMNFRVKKTQVSPKYKLWELKNQIMCNVKTVCPKK